MAVDQLSVTLIQHIEARLRHLFDQKPLTKFLSKPDPIQ
jgi:hypothetical protein